MGLLLMILCFAGVYVMCKMEDRDKPWQTYARNADKLYFDKKITHDEWFTMNNEAFRMQHGLTKAQYDPDRLLREKREGK